MKKLQEIIGYEFVDKGLLQKALTHSSVAKDAFLSYERLEFLGDRVLGVAVASALFNRFAFEQEGKLSQRFVQLVCKETVAEVGLKLGIDKYIRVETDSLRRNVNVLCDVVEAIIGAVYEDGGHEEAVRFVNRVWDDWIERDVVPPKDEKTKLQEKTLGLGIGIPQYKVVERLGSEHEPLFVVEVCLTTGQKAQGTGKNKKQAEFDAAANLLELMK